MRRIRTAEEFTRWLTREPGIAVVVYFIGDMSVFRRSAPRMIVALEARIDAQTDPRKPLPLRDRFKIDELRRDLALIGAALRFAESGDVHLTQSRLPDGSWQYLATRHRRRS